MRKLLIALAAVSVLAPLPASAGLIYDASIVLSAQGFGTAPRDLTVQRTGHTTSPESGCVAVASGSMAVGPGACMDADAALMPNGVVNAGGDEPSPLDDNQKYGVPFASERGIVSASDIGVLFNATEPQGDAINVIDLTLKFYLDGGLVGSIDGQQQFASSNPGNGVAGFVFVVDELQTAYVNSLLALGDIQFALEATMTGSSGGPESFRLVDLNRTHPHPVPEPTSLALAAVALLGAAGARRRP